jgi:hypothetical protein
MFAPTVMTSNVTGGFDGEVEGKRWVEASQSSLKSGSSSRWEIRAGRRVERSARWVVRERSGRGYDSGGERRRIW